MDNHPNYEILETIGQGNESTIYRARDFALKRFVAIKELKDKQRQDPRRLGQFVEEAQFLANLGHENVVSVYGVEPARGWIVMELMRGSLAQKLLHGALSPDLVRSVLRQTLEALVFLHGKQRIHGQISPSSILIDDAGRVKLSGFGGTAVGAEFRRPAGNHKYLAPELLRSEQFGAVGKPVDLYCLGFTALELLMGKPFDGLFSGVSIDPKVGWMRWHSSPTERLLPCAKLVPGAPADLAAVIDQLLQKPVASRLASAAAALDQLENGPLLMVDLNAGAVDANGSRAAGQTEVDYIIKGQAEFEVLPETNLKAVGQSKVVATKKAGAPVAKSKPDSTRGKATANSSMAGKSPVVHKRFSRAWFNQKLENKLILYPLLATLLIGAVAIALLWNDESAEANVPVAASDTTTPTTITSQTATKSPTKNKAISPLKSGATVQVVAVATPAAASDDGGSQSSAAKPVSMEESLGLRALGNGRFVSLKLAAAGAPLELAKFEAGEFRFGVPAADLQVGELPVEVGRIQLPFYLSATEITNRQYSVFAKEAGDEIAGLKWREAWKQDPAHDDAPVVNVSVEQARAFCKWLGGRLPNEREWERAARGIEGRTTPWTSGAADAVRCKLRFSDNSSLVKTTDLLAGATPEGLVHLLGNAAEWCDDTYSAGHLETSHDPGVNQWHVVRGGSYLDPPHRMRITSRTNCRPEGAGHIGFRVALTHEAR